MISSFCSTVSQTVAPNNFTVDTITQRILSEIDLHSTKQPLQSCISNVENEPVSHYSANQTNVIQKGPPHNNQWRCPDGQTNPLFQPSGTSGSVHFGSNRGDHSSLLIRKLRTTNTKGSRYNSRKKTKEKERPIKLMLLREKFSYMKLH